jgi:hypothetical protein
VKSEVLLDTNVVIDFLRGTVAAVALIRSLNSSPALSAVTVAEIVAGLKNRREEAGAETLFANSQVLPIGSDIARRAGVFVRLYGASQSVDIPDALIAATAEHHGLKLATLNVKHFPMFARLRPAY